MTSEGNIYSFVCQNTLGEEINLSDYKGETLLIVNTASKCGFTSQYKGLEKLQLKYKDKGFKILAFPCNQFGQQEPGSNKEIQEFCNINYQTTFPLFAKVDVNGEGAHPLYKYLTSNIPGILGFESIKWNFTKFLINKDGLPLRRFAPNTTPEKIDKELDSLLI